MPIVEAPDGTEIEFPDEMSNSDIEGVLKKQYTDRPAEKLRLSDEMAKLRREGFLGEQAQAALGAAENIAKVAAIPATPILKLPRSEGTGIGSGLANVGAGLAEGLSAPAYWLMPQSRPLQALVASQMAGQLPESTANAVSTLKNPLATPAQKVEAAASPVLQAGVAGLIAKGLNATQGKIESTGGIPVEQQGVPIDRGTEEQTQGRTPQRVSEGEQAVPPATEVQEVKAPPSVVPGEVPQQAPSAGEAKVGEAATSPTEPAIRTTTGSEPIPQGGGSTPLIGMGGATPEELASSAGADIYGIAERVRQERAAAGQTPGTLPGEGVSDVEAVLHGRQILSVDPTAALKAADAFEKTKSIGYDAIAVVRAKGEEASQAARNIEQKFGTDSTEYQNAFENLAKWDKLSKDMQTEWHKSGMAQQGQTDIDTGTFTGLQRAYTEATGKTFDKPQARKAREFADQTTKSTASTETAKQNLFKTLDIGDVDPQVQSLANRIIATLDKGANDALARIKARRAEGRLFTGIDPEALADYAIYGASKLAKGAVKFSSWSAEMVNELGDYIKPHLKQIWEAANNHLDETVKDAPESVKKAVKRVPPTPDATRTLIADHQPGEAFTSDQVKGIWNYAKERYLNQGVTDFTDVVHGIATDLGIKAGEVRQALAQPKGARRMTDEVYKKMAEHRRIQQSAKVWVKELQTPGWIKFIRSVPRIFFLDKIFGHGTVGMITHAGLNIFNPYAWKAYWPEFFRQFGLAFKPGYHEQIMQDLAHDPLFIKARRSGLANDPWRYADDYQNAAMKTFMGKFSGLIGNNGFDALKTFRQKRFNQIWNSLPDSLKTDTMAKLLSPSINHASGIVGTPFREWASWTFFAPKLEGSRWAWAIGDTAKTLNTFKEWKTASPEERYLAMSDLKQKAAITGTYFGLLAMNQGLLSAMGSKQKINFTDPRRGDFLAFKVAGHNVGIVSPMLGMVRLFANLYHDARGKRGPLEKLGSRGAEMAEDIGSYARGKLSPFAGQAYNLISQSDFQGRPLPFSSDPVPAYLRRRGIKKYTYGEYAAQELSPIPIEEAIKEVWAKQGIDETTTEKYLKALTIAIAAGGTGARVSKDYYEGKK